MNYILVQCEIDTNQCEIICCPNKDCDIETAYKDKNEINYLQNRIRLSTEYSNLCVAHCQHETFVISPSHMYIDDHFQIHFCLI